MRNNSGVRVWQDPCLLGLSIAFLQYRGEELFIKNGRGGWDKVVNGTAIVPTLQLDLQEAQELIDAIKGLGVKSDVDAKRDGKLEATERHLADLRQMLKLK